MGSNKRRLETPTNEATAGGGNLKKKNFKQFKSKLSQYFNACHLQVAVVTGAGHGIGRCLALQLSKLGVN